RYIVRLVYRPSGDPSTHGGCPVISRPCASLRPAGTGETVGDPAAAAAGRLVIEAAAVIADDPARTAGRSVCGELIRAVHEALRPAGPLHGAAAARTEHPVRIAAR